MRLGVITTYSAVIAGGRVGLERIGDEEILNKKVTLENIDNVWRAMDQPDKR